MKLTKALIDWLVENRYWGEAPNADEITPAITHNLKGAAAQAMADGKLTAEKYRELAQGEKESKPMSTKATKLFGGPSIRVKDESEKYTNKRHVGRHVKSGEEVFNPFTGQLAEIPSESDYAKAEVLLKHLAQRSGLFPGLVLPEHEKSLLAEMATNDPWCGMVAGEHHENVKGVKALIDDATSGGIEIVPLPLDTNIVTFPLLSGELLPFVDLQPLDKGRRIQAGSIGNPTISWGQGDNTEVSLFDTTSLVASLDSTVFGCAVAVEVGRDFLSDAGVNVGQTLVANIGERLANELDKIIATGNGTTQPEGIFTASGLGTVNTENGAAGPPTFADYVTAAFAIDKQYRNRAYRPRFLTNDTSYQRSRAIKIDTASPSTDQRPVLAPNSANAGFEDYVTLGWPHSIQNDVPNASCCFGALSKYRLYRRVGMEVRWVDGGETLARKNLVLLVVRGRYAGRVMDANAFATWTDGQS